MKVCLVMCGKHKKPFIHKARNLYSSNRFKKALEQSAEICDSTFIISAKYGLLNLNKWVLPYDINLSKQPKQKQLKWAEDVSKTIIKKVCPDTEIHFFAEPIYYEDIQKLLKSSGYKTFIH